MKRMEDPMRLHCCEMDTVFIGDKLIPLDEIFTQRMRLPLGLR